jgi:hypothetical protein
MTTKPVRPSQWSQITFDKDSVCRYNAADHSPKACEYCGQTEHTRIGAPTVSSVRDEKKSQNPSDVKHANNPADTAGSGEPNCRNPRSAQICAENTTKNETDSIGVGPTRHVHRRRSSDLAHRSSSIVAHYIFATSCASFRLRCQTFRR